MALLTTSELLRAFSDHVRTSNQIDIAVAWLAPSGALETLVRKTAQGILKTRIAVSLHGNATSPIALRSLQSATAQLRVGSHATGIYHPKFYLFRGPRRNVCWIGSANLTLGGFAKNFELMHEFIDDGAASLWFEDLWASLPTDPGNAIDSYERDWVRPPPSARVAEENIGWEDDPAEVLAAVTNWNGYISALRECDSLWRFRSEQRFSVLGDEWSWIDTILHGHSIAQRGNWIDLSRGEMKILLGLETNDSTGTWGLLGNMQAAAGACASFQADGALRRHIRENLQSVIDARNEDQFVIAAEQAIHIITDLPYFGPAVATRLIALARPDMGISVNDGSAHLLSRLTGLSKNAGTLGNTKNYPRLLRWIYAQPWYKITEPSEALERTIWSMRAAIMDSFVYQQV